jgi:tRNA (guanine37-N1)-methyltransferase
MRIDILTLFPDMVDRILSESVVGRGRGAGLFSVQCHQIRHFAENKHNNVDDTPYGGGNGMVMAPGPIKRCFDAAVADADPGESRRVIYLSPKGAPLNQTTVERLSGYDRLVLLCGHYEGVDQRVLDAIVDEEISIGDYVLTGGELPACVLTDAIVRLIPGVLASPECHEEESISSGLLEYPQYTRPAVWEGVAVPEILLSGDHGKIRAWRLEKSLALTEQRRPEMAEAWRAAHPPKEKKPRRRRASEKAEP